ncbi:hypothetical protein [Trinickia mobilis]|uniref:hypothetical protein n=1 Tax=Trinickia mobilis TaxID=2816356 RepID=UPI001A8E1356|nr:hypothetical protein [Trinickia mobilis]
MEEYFVTRSSAIAWVVSEHQALIEQEGNRVPDQNGVGRRARIEELAQLLFDVRAGRTLEFLLPTSRGRVRVFVTPD